MDKKRCWFCAYFDINTRTLDGIPEARCTKHNLTLKSTFLNRLSDLTCIEEKTNADNTGEI